MFILGNQFLLPADKAENEDLVGEGVSGAQSFLPVSRFWHFLSRVACDDQVASLGSQPCSTLYVTPV